jgi:hypothetical protein
MSQVESCLFAISLDDEQFKLNFPRLTIQLNDPNSNVVFSIIDVQGNLVIEERSAAAITDLDISSFANGVYYLNIGTQVVKVVKQ